MPNKKATIVPVQAPVKGKGIATKLTKAISPYFSIPGLLFLLVLSKSQSKNLWKSLELSESHLETGPKNKSKNTIGTKFPKTEIKKAISQIYKVTPERINILSIPDKHVFVRGKKGTKGGGKKAVVYLKKGDEIKFV